MNIHLRIVGLALVLTGACGFSAHAGILPILLDINEANSADVVFTATGLDPSVNFSGTGAIILTNFFRADPGATGRFTGNLTPAGPSAVALTGYAISGIKLYLTANPETFQFSTSDAAFTGVGAANLATFSRELQANGAMGSLDAGSTVIGEWKIVNVAPVPEPSQYGFFIALAVAGLVAVRRLTARVA